MTLTLKTFSPVCKGILFIMICLHKIDNESSVYAFAPALSDRIQQCDNHHRYETDSMILRMALPNSIDSFTSGVASLVRMPQGVTVQKITDDVKIAILYDVDNSDKCRRVREKITEYNLVVSKVVPAAPNSRVFQDPEDEYALPANSIIPRMIVLNDEGDKTTLEGSEEIIRYLDEINGVVFKDDVMEGEGHLLGAGEEIASDAWDKVGMVLASLVRLGRGTEVSSCAMIDKRGRPEKPLILYSYEGNQFCRLVREVLTELDLVYELKSCGKGSPRRAELAALSGGSSQCPYLVDPNHPSGELKMAESGDVVRYLYETYASWIPPAKTFQIVSQYVMPVLKPVFQFSAPLLAGSSNEDKTQYKMEIEKAQKEIEKNIASDPVVVYTYSLSPFCKDALAILDGLGVDYKEISLGREWIPGLINTDGGAQTRVALGELTGQTSLPHIFVNKKSIGGLYSGTPGLIPSLEQAIFLDMVNNPELTSETKPTVMP